jgi:hypothetical protein
MPVPVNTVLPSFTGTALASSTSLSASTLLDATGIVGDGATLTATLGTWTNTPTSLTYEIRILVATNEPTSGMTTAGLGSPYKTIAGTSGTTTNPAFTFPYVLGPSDASKALYVHVTATNGSGSASADSATKLFYTSKIPWKSAGNAFTNTIPLDAPISSSLTAALRSQLETWYTNGKKWWMQGGSYGSAYSAHLLVVDSSMPRTPFKLIGRQVGWPAGNIQNPKAPAVQNADAVSHLAWTFGVKNGGIPTPPGGFQISGPVSNPALGQYGDNHFTVYVQDTHELYEVWAAGPITADTPNQWALTGGETVHTDYPLGSWVCGWGGYVRDVTATPGYWLDKVDADGNNEYATWGARATSLPFFSTVMLTREMVTDATIGHSLGVITPGSNGSYVWPAQRSDVGEGGSLPQGIRWWLDPTINVAALPSTGNAQSDILRALMFEVAQNHGLVTSDSTGSDIIIQMEAMGGDYPSIPGVFDPGSVSFDAVMRSVPSTSWSVVSPTWRPPGATAVPRLIDYAGWLGMHVSGFGGVSFINENYDKAVGEGDRVFIELIQPAGNNGCSWAINPSVNTSGAFYNVNMAAGTLDCHMYYWYNADSMTPVSVPYDPVAHKWLSFVNIAGNVSFQVSPGGVSTDPEDWTWTQLMLGSTTTAGWTLDQVGMFWYVGGTDTTQIAYWDNLNTVPADAGGTSAGWVLGVG